MENTPRQQAAADGLVAAAVLALGAVLVAAGSSLARDLAPGASGSRLRIAPRALDALPSVDVLLGLVATLVGLAVVAWWLLSMGFAIASALLAAAGASTASRRVGSFAPAFMRRLAMAMLGLGLVAVPAAHADSLPDPAWRPAASGPAAAVQGTPASAPVAPPAPEAGWVPAAPPTDPGPLVQQPLRPPAHTSQVEVRPGDSLWTIVARHLGAGATDLDIAQAWPSWYEANAGIIGGNPDLIRPGQILVPPR
ncbi:LysM peptidoglycan-binding domain-containing protein [Sinomonas sp. RB5]